MGDNMKEQLEARMSFKVITKSAAKQWERLIGTPINSDYVWVTNEYYLDNAVEIQAIQMQQGFVLAMKRDMPKRPGYPR